ncbi:MAG: chromosomal replication initiator protein DnaA, partial [Alphaproteobacteria bacterium]|nr:chromosomal replication initiator protein DnaA [Alphaproteobacteria bacterium]
MNRLSEARWERVRARLRAEFGDAAFNSWLKPLALEAEHDGGVKLTAPTRFMRDWVMSHYGERVRTFWQGESADIREVEIGVRAQQAAADEAGSDEELVDGARAVPPLPVKRPVAGRAAVPGLGSPVDPRFRFESFIVGRSNELA